VIKEVFSNVAKIFLFKLNIFLFKIIFLFFLDYFNVLLFKINFKNKNIILIYFQIINILKYNFYHISK